MSEKSKTSVTPSIFGDDIDDLKPNISVLISMDCKALICFIAMDPSPIINTRTRIES